MATTYLMSYHNAEEQVIETSIEDSGGSLGTVALIAGEEGSVSIGAVDNDELKYGIKATRATIKFINSDTINLDTFSTGEDGKWKVTITVNTKIIFLGWLEQGGISQLFLPLGTQIVTLTAIDGLAYLSDAPYVDFDGVTIVNKFRTDITIAKHIARCLARTGLALNINVIDNRREENNPGVTWLDSCSVFPETWEDTINTAIASRDVLERILDPDSYCCQSKGAWWIIRTTEVRQDFNTYLTVFDSTGTLTAGFTATTLEKTIGSPTTNPAFSAYFSEAATIESRNRPYKSTELDYKYELPAEILCNSNLVRGDFIADLADEVDEDGNTLTVKSFNTDCWLYQRNVPPDTQDSTEYTKVRYAGGQEKERYIHMETAANNDFYYLTSQEQIPVSLSDKFKIGCSIRYGTDLGGGSGHFQVHQIWVRLYADDGTFWNLHSVSGTGSSDPGTYWMQSDVTWGTNQRFCDFEGETQNVDFTQWQILNFDAAPCPRSGKLEILLINNQTAASQSKDFSSLSFEYIPYIDGSYGIISGQSYTATQSGDYRRKIDQQVYLGNAPRPIFKGAIKVISGGNYVLAGKFYEGQQFPADDPTSDDLFDFGYLQDICFHNQNRNTDQKYLATCQGREFGQEDSDGNADVIDLIHKVYNRDIDPVANNTALQLVNQEVNWRTCSWTATLITNFDVNIGFADDPVVFAYLGGAFSGGGGGTGGGGGGTAPGGRFAVATEDDTAAQDRAFDATGFDFSINNADNINLGGFGSNTHTGDPTRGLSVTSTGKVIETTQPPREVMYQFQQITPGTDPTIIGSGGVGDLTYFGIATLVPAFVSTGVYSFTFPSNLLLLGKTAVEVIGMDGGSPIFITVDTSGTLGSDSNAFFVYLFNISGSPVDSSNAYQMIIKVYY